jgi:3-isopropylmalate/(R)-2-methylmalate dehydratase small subunit
VLRHFLFEGIDPAFAASVQPGDVIVAGKNFGCGSAMEIAVTAVLGAGIPMVIAASFSRIYFRNAVNNGLVPVICDTRAIAEGDRLRLDRSGDLAVRNETSGKILPVQPIPPVMLAILSAGGLVPYMRAHGGFVV